MAQSRRRFAFYNGLALVVMVGFEHQTHHLHFIRLIISSLQIKNLFKMFIIPHTDVTFVL